MSRRILSLYCSFSNCFNNSSSFAFYINGMYILTVLYLLLTVFSDPFIFSIQFLFPQVFSGLSSISLFKFLFKCILLFTTCSLFFIHSVSLSLVSFYCIFPVLWLLMFCCCCCSFLSFKYLILGVVHPCVYVRCVCVSPNACSGCLLQFRVFVVL